MKPDSAREIDSYLKEAETWASDRRAGEERSRRIAWIIAGTATAVAALEAIARAAMVPRKTVEPNNRLGDRQTGNVEALQPLERQTISADAALTRSFLVQYVIARESFDLAGVRANYRKVALWSAPEVRTVYSNMMQASNPASPFVNMPRNAQVDVTVKSVSSLGPSTSLVRFRTTRSDASGQGLPPRDWAAVISYRYSGAPMSADDRLLNPLGFEVTRYRRDAETIPAPASELPQAAPPTGAAQVPISMPSTPAPRRVIRPGKPPQ